MKFRIPPGWVKVQGPHGPELRKRPGVGGHSVKPRAPAGRKMNRWERAYADKLEEQRRLGLVAAWWYQGLTLRLAHDTRYTPDFLVERAASPQLELHEVKGFYRDDARVKVQVAAAMFPFRVYICRLEEGLWVLEPVKV